MSLYIQPSEIKVRIELSERLKNWCGPGEINELTRSASSNEVFDRITLQREILRELERQVRVESDLLTELKRSLCAVAKREKGVLGLIEEEIRDYEGGWTDAGGKER